MRLTTSSGSGAPLALEELTPRDDTASANVCL